MRLLGGPPTVTRARIAGSLPCWSRKGTTMPERETIADGAELDWQRKAIWLLVRALGGEVTIADAEWELVPERPELVIDRADGLMRWTAKEPPESGAAASLA